MAKARLGRVALEVADVHAAAATFTALFDFEFQIFDVPAEHLRVAVGGHGLELLQSLTPGWVPKPLGVLAGVAIGVHDVEETCAQMKAKGCEVLRSFPLQSGRREYVFAPIHGIPILIYQEAGHLDLIAQ